MKLLFKLIESRNFVICWAMILVLHQIESVEEDVLLCFGEIQLIVVSSIILLIILVLKLKKKVVGLECSLVFMDFRKLVEEETPRILLIVLLDK